MRVVLTGASGQLGAYVLDTLGSAGHDVSAWSGASRGGRGGFVFRPVDLSDERQVARALGEADPEMVIHAAAVSTADAVRRDPGYARRVNVEATGHLAAWCARKGRRLLYVSSDMVFDGSKGMYREDDPPRPVLEYGRTKAEAEPAVTGLPRGLVVRFPLLFGPTRTGKPAFFDNTTAALRRGEVQTLFEDEFRTPLDLASAASALVELADSDLTGIVHVAGPERVSRFELGRRSAAALGLDASLVRANRRSDVNLPEPRPADISLDSSRFAAHFPGFPRPVIEDAIRSLVPAV
jgi:dTDP-4-dehydrorhamnose reductase